MVVKSKRVEDHLSDLKEAFNILGMGIKAGRLLRYVVTKMGIKSCAEYIKTIINLNSPTSTKDIQWLIDRKRGRSKHVYLKILREVKTFLRYLIEKPED